MTQPPTIEEARKRFGKSPIRLALIADHKSRAFDVWLIHNIYAMMQEAQGARITKAQLRRMLLLIARSYSRGKPDTKFTPDWILEIIVSLRKNFDIVCPHIPLHPNYWKTFADTLEKKYGQNR